jgi:DNA-binding GntR family transcriptional regulator
MDSLKLQAYNTIKERIILCEYPPNSLLNEERLREELKISRTPIRDALSRLEQESLIQILPKRGIMVKSISPEDVEQVFEMRMLIEPYALKKYGHTMDRAVLSELEAFFSQKPKDNNSDVIFKRDDEFHHLIVDASKNTFLIDAYRSVYIQNVRLRIINGNFGNDRLTKSQKEHLEITKWCLKGKWDKAADLMNEHLMISREISYNSINNLQVLLKR